MNWVLFGSTFILIFMAELGDKTQLAVMSQSAASSSKWTVFAAGVLALVASTAIGVMLGDVIRKFVPDERYIKCVGGALFLLFGALMMRDVFLPKAKAVETPQPATADADVASGSGWIGNFVIRQAMIFEQSAFEDYTALAARSLDPDEKAVFERLALEESWHHQAMLSALAAGAENDIPITAEMAAALPAMDELIHDAVRTSKEVEHAIKHELAMAQFYRALSEKTLIPRLKETFAGLAVIEENHAKRLMALQQRGTNVAAEL